MSDDESWRNELTTMGTPRKVPPRRKRGPKWEPKHVEIAYNIIPDAEFDQLLKEMAEIIYDHFRQQAVQNPDQEKPKS